MSVKPSAKFLVLVNQVHGTVNAAAEVWGVHPNILYNFVKGTGGISLDTAAQIARKTGVGLDDLFTIEPVKEPKR